MPLSVVVLLMSEVIQRSDVGQVMFTVYIDYLAKLLEHHGVTRKLFADDVKLYLLHSCRLKTPTTQIQYKLEGGVWE